MKQTTKGHFYWLTKYSRGGKHWLMFTQVAAEFGPVLLLPQRLMNG